MNENEEAKKKDDFLYDEPLLFGDVGSLLRRGRDSSTPGFSLGKEVDLQSCWQPAINGKKSSSPGCFHCLPDVHGP